MADFLESRQQLQQARAGQSAAQQERDAARRRLQRMDAQISQLARQANGNNPAAGQHLEQLQNERTKANELLQQAESQYAQAGKLLDGRYGSFFEFSDPTQFVSRLDDALPFLLFPVRIETRFKTIASAVAAPQQELWVRIYPDDCLIDTFEPTLSGTEITAARRYYIESWKAGGIEQQERAAWRGLVSSVGAGRAAWILQNFAPLNPGDKPVKATADAVVLIIAADQALPLAQTEVFSYWRAVWQAKGDAAMLITAFQNLVNAPGSSAAIANQVVQDFAPDNIREWANSEQADAAAALVQFTPYPDLDTKNFSWTQAPKVTLFPDRFVFIGQNGGQPLLERLFRPLTLPLVVGPDPTDAQQFIEKDGDLELTEEIRWMTDFEAAVQKGLGLKVPLNNQQAANGFERVFVVGVRLSADAEQNAGELENLLKNHLYSRNGFAIVPQGTPTNNTEEVESAFQRTDDADDSYDAFVKHIPQFTPSTDPLLKRDGQWLAEWLGLNPAALQQVPNAGQRDQLEARAMNTALWPATWGYYFERMLHPVLDDQAIRRTRSFFNRYVSGRGPVPAIRIGRQPYGILPVTPFRKIGWIPQVSDRRNEAETAYLNQLYQLLLQLDDLWRGLGGQVDQVGLPGDPDPQKTLLHILGLHPTAEEIHAVLGEPYYVSYNTKVYNGLGEIKGKQTPDAAGGDLLRELGYDGYDIPENLTRNYFGRPFQLHKNLVDDIPPSETEPVRDYTPDPLNYLEWLLKKAQESVDDLRQEAGFTDNKKPAAVLYLFLRQALLLAFEGVARESKRPHVSLDMFQAWKAPQTFIHVAEAGNSNQPQPSESPWAHLYLDFPAVTNRAEYPLAQYIIDHLATLNEAGELREQLAALDLLTQTPTAALERLLREHLDLCHYRLDAWKMGLLNLQLSFMRFSPQANDGAENQAKRGLHLGAYGWLENVKPKAKQLQPVQLNEELNTVFNPADSKLPPLVRDSSNGGFIHAPSLNQAVTASVLRNGYRANATPGDPDLLAVNLSSERVRQSVGLIEGIRNGQKLGALLGYHFERDLHDAGTGLDKFILELRTEFSLNAQKLKTTQTPNTPVEFIEANNVVDGFALMNFLDKNKTAPDPLSAILPGSTAAERGQVIAAARKLFDLADGVADVALAESVHQVVMGNYDRAAATMDAYAAANLPPEPEVVRTPRSGHTLTHRVGIQLRPNAAAVAGDNPRHQAEPSLNDWLADHLPPAADLGVVVHYYPDPANPATFERLFVTQADLDLAPLDLLFTVSEGATQAASDLDDLVLAFVATRPDVRPDTRIELAFVAAEPGRITFFEATPLLTSLRALALRSRPLEATDVQLPGEASVTKTGPIRLDTSRIDAVAVALGSLKTAANNFLVVVQPDADGGVLTALDSHLDQFRQLSTQAGLFGLPHTGFAMAWQNRADIYTAIRQKLTALTLRWAGHLAASQAITTAIIVPTDADVEALQEAGRLVSTRLLPADALPAALSVEVLSRQNLFEAKLMALQAILAASPNTLSAFHQQVLTELPLTDFEPLEFNLNDQTGAMQTLLDELLLRARAMAAEADRRLLGAAAKVAAQVTEADPVKQVQLLQEAGKTLLGDDFRMIPAFKVSTATGFEWKNAYDSTNGLLNYVKTRAENPLPLPVDEWLHGAARVREKMFHLENTMLLSGAFGQAEPNLQPLQLPFRAGEDWLALEFDPANPANTLETERLLYTAHYAEALQPADWQCGLLVDEWTEVIPQKEEVTGLAFHFDRPNAEPPQAWLLATPATFTGAWQWEDLLAVLNQTLDDARTRAVEPDILGQRFAALLPAVLTETSWSPMTISANLIARAAREFTTLAVQNPS